MGFLKNVLGKKKKTTRYCSAVIVAGGKSTRMEGEDKILAPLGGEPLILHGLEPFQASDLVDEIVIVAREDLMAPIGDLCSRKGITKVRRVVNGGAARQDSVLAGIQAADERADIIAIHDGARPFVTREIIEETIKAARRCSAAAPAIPVKDTIKRAKDGIVTETPDRAELFAVQTPQVFEANLIRTAVGKAVQDGILLTDDCAAVERLGFPVKLTQGSEENIKITTPRDLVHGEAILAEREGH
ncbi:MAG: 2-C-methyl-D-erythritol 4-phosphate cytidylyltransferase [Ruminiclostridium sp.]|nr:2-C-methyl-D-erythritol 4-phosphate cytidylyltransferase [Ruminiclostridium sp.]